MVRSLIGTVLSLALTLPIAGPAAAATLCVNPGGTGGCFATIQGAVDVSASRDVIEVAAGTYVGSVALNLVGRLTIRGAGPGATIIESSPGAQSTVGSFGLNDVTLSGVELRNGNVGVKIGDYAKFVVRDCIIADHTGSAIYADQRTKVTVEDCVIAGNGDSGLFANDSAVGSRGSSLRVVRSEIRDNTGGGIGGDFKVEVIASTIRDNGLHGIEATSGSIIGSTVSGNGTTYGRPAVSFGAGRHGSAKIVNSTISGNHGPGLAVYDRSGVQLDQVTIASNVATAPDPKTGGIYTVGGRVSAKSTIIADNAPNDCFGMIPGYEAPVRLAGVNLIESAADCTLLGAPALVAAPLLGPLQDNGGPTETQALLAGSPAIGARVAGCSGVDQRGQPRTRPCDLGAYETP
jgi:hypothetical protein